MSNITKEDLIEFEKEIADIYSTGIIKAPVHLRSGREDQLIAIFNKYNISHDDYIFGYWDSHELALLKGVPRDAVKHEILLGNSIALFFSEHRVICSGIVGSLMGVAAGTAWSIKKANKPEHVYHFCGEMSAETGIFHESVKYAFQHDLPITFVVCDNGVSVMTKTRDTWGCNYPWFSSTKYFNGNYKRGPNIEYFQYENGYPHSGLGRLIKF